MTDDMSAKQNVDPPKVKPRAQRFPIQAPIRYRESGESSWSDGITINISSSGVLFWAEKSLQRKTPIEMQIIFPLEVTGGNPVNITCSGRVVRALSVPPPDTRNAVAAAILHFRMRPDLDAILAR